MLTPELSLLSHSLTFVAITLLRCRPEPFSAANKGS